MQKSVNRVTLIGVVDREPEVRDFPSGGQVLSVWVKTSEQWNDRQTGELRERSQTNRVSVYVAPMIRELRDSLQTNDLVYVEGRMETRRVEDQHGGERYFTEVSVRPYHGSIATLGQIQISESGGGGHASPGAHDDRGSIDGGYGGGHRGSDSGAAPAPGQADPDDEIPF
ncbi:MAG: single-stranded DNA-binding protein [Rhodobacteraceae bacterium]|nr:single-stranded DNA-binding protein [Paracoccaceae bacterium]